MEMSETKTKGQETAADVAALLRARNSLLWVVTREEARVEGHLFEAAAAAGYNCRTWDVAQGFASIDGTPETGLGQSNDADSAFDIIGTRAKQGDERCVW